MSEHGIAKEGKTRTGDGLCTARVGNADESLQELSMFFMIPVGKNDSVLRIVGVLFLGWVDDHGSTKPIGIVCLSRS